MARSNILVCHPASLWSGQVYFGRATRSSAYIRRGVWALFVIAFMVIQFPPDTRAADLDVYTGKWEAKEYDDLKFDHDEIFGHRNYRVEISKNKTSRLTFRVRELNIVIPDLVIDDDRLQGRGEQKSDVAGQAGKAKLGGWVKVDIKFERDPGGGKYPLSFSGIIEYEGVFPNKRIDAELSPETARTRRELNVEEALEAERVRAREAEQRLSAERSVASDATGQIERLESQVSLLQNQRELGEKKAANLQRENAGLHGQVAQLEMFLSRTQEQLGIFQERQAEFLESSEQHEDAKRQLARLSEQLAEQKKTSRDLSERLQTTEQALTEEARGHVEAKTALAEAEQILGELENTGIISERQARVSAESEVQALRKERSALQERLDSALATRNDALGKFQTTAGTRDAMENSLKDALASLDSANAELNRLRHEKSSSQSKLSQALSALDSTEIEFSKRNFLIAELTEQNQQLLSANKNYSAARDREEEIDLALRRKISEIEAENLELKRQNNGITQDLKYAQKQMRAAEINERLSKARVAEANADFQSAHIEYKRVLKLSPGEANAGLKRTKKGQARVINLAAERGEVDRAVEALAAFREMVGDEDPEYLILSGQVEQLRLAIKEGGDMYFSTQKCTLGCDY